MKILLFVNEGLPARIAMSPFLERNPDFFHAVAAFPVIPKKARTGGINWNVPRRILSGSLAFPFMITIAYFGYVALARILGNDMRQRLWRGGIPMHRFSGAGSELERYLTEVRPDIVVNCSATLLGPAILAIPKHGIINYHGAPLPQYRGAANQFWMLLAGERSFRPTLHWMDRGLDTGAIISQGPEVEIPPGISVFGLWMRMLEGCSPMMEDLAERLRAEVVPKGHAQDEALAASRSFPGSADVARIRRAGHPLLRWADFKAMFRLAITR